MKEVNITIMRGDSKDLSITVLNEAGVAVDITGAIVNFKVAKDKAKAPQIALTNGEQVSITNGPAGKLDIRLRSEDTLPLLGDYNYEVELVFPFGGVSTVLFGTLTIMQDIRVEGSSNG